MDRRGEHDHQNAVLDKIPGYLGAAHKGTDDVAGEDDVDQKIGERFPARVIENADPLDQDSGDDQAEERQLHRQHICKKIHSSSTSLRVSDASILQ